MEPRTEDQLFQDFRRTGDPAALAEVFDRTAPELLRIALHLAGDVARAEDLVQATFVTAIESAATFDAERQLLPWLAGILTNRARELRRKESRAIDPERLARRSGEDPLRHAQDLELRSHLDEAIRTLPEIYRPVLVLHLRHGLDAAAIAGALQRRVGTVRSQLVRGLEMLRKLLPAGLAISALAGISTARGLAVVRTEVLAAAAAWGPAAVGAATAAGGISLAGGGAFVMKKVVFAVLVVALGAVCWLAWPNTVDPDTGTRTAAVKPAAAEAHPASGAAAAASPAEVAARKIAVDVPAAAPRTSLLVRVLWGDDKSPAGGIALTARPWSMRPIGLHDVAAVTSAEGTALLRDVPHGRVEVWLDRGGRGEVDVEPGARAETVIEVPPGVTVQGAVVRKDGAPVRGARIWISKQQVDDEGQVAATTGDDGSFVLRSVQAGRSLSVFAAGYAPSVLDEVKGRIGDTVALRFVLQHPGRRVHGRVVDPSGRPVEGATVVLGRLFVNGQKGQFPPASPPTWLRTDERGEFATGSVWPGAAVPIHARAPGFAPWKGDVPPQADDREALEIRLAQGVTVSGRVLDSAGRPCAGARVEAGRFDTQAPSWLVDRVTTTEDGSFRLSGIAPGQIPVGAGRPKERGVRDVLTAADGQEVQWNPVLGLGLEIAGKVLDERREPLAGWLVGARPSSDAMTQKFGKTDASGHFAIADCDPGDHKLEIGDPASGGICPALAVDGVAAGSAGVLVIVPDAKQPSARITGRVFGVDGRPAVGVPVSVRSELANGSAPIKTEAAKSQAEAGRFTTRTLPPGKYEVTVNALTLTPLELGWKSLAPDQTLDLGEIRLQIPGTFLVTARRQDGAPLTTTELCQLVRPDGSVRRIGPMREGKLNSWSLVQFGRYEVRIWDKETFIAACSFEVRSGEATQAEIETSPGFVRKVVFHEEPLPANTVIRIAWEDIDRGPLWQDSFTAGEAFGFTGSIERAFAKGRYRVRAETSLGTKGEGSFEVGGTTRGAEPIRIPLR